MLTMGKMALLAALALVIGAAKPEPDPKDVAPPKADVRGTVKNLEAVKAGGFIGRLSVEGKKEKDTQYDRASVAVVAGAKIFRWKGGKKVEAKFADIKNGCVVQCVFTGAVETSLPVGAMASEVLILSTPKK